MGLLWLSCALLSPADRARQPVSAVTGLAQEVRPTEARAWVSEPGAAQLLCIQVFCSEEIAFLLWQMGNRQKGCVLGWGPDAGSPW